MRILLIRTSALGDVVHALPVLTALRRRFPESRIGWAIEASLAPLLRGHRDLDDILEVDLRGWRRRPLAPRTLRELGSAIRTLRAFKPDITLDLMGNHKGGILARLAGGRLIGAQRRDRREPSSAMWMTRTVALSGTHAAERTLSLLRGIEIDGEPLASERLDFGAAKLLPEVPATAGRWLERRARPFVFIHPGAAWGNKRYPVAAWGEVSRALAGALDCDVVIGAGPGEEQLAEQVCAASGGSAEMVAAPTLADLAAIVRRARLVLGGDTGPLHLAHALAAPTIFVMGPTDPARHGPFASQDGAVHVTLPCSGCYKRFESAKACLLAIPPGAIVARALARLGADAGRR